MTTIRNAQDRGIARPTIPASTAGTPFAGWGPRLAA
jgi:hypothetical protein